MQKVGSSAKGAKIFAILVKNNLVLRTSQQSVVKGAWAFLQPMAAPAVSHPGA